MLVPVHFMSPFQAGLIAKMLLASVVLSLFLAMIALSNTMLIVVSGRMLVVEVLTVGAACAASDKLNEPSVIANDNDLIVQMGLDC